MFSSRKRQRMLHPRFRPTALLSLKLAFAVALAVSCCATSPSAAHAPARPSPPAEVPRLRSCLRFISPASHATSKVSSWQPHPGRFFLEAAMQVRRRWMS
ncbi:hypothetical protein GQ55_3G074200 [Panicum hallii var. hallii]|uniref:Secreted protein n=1 Tax=Panicum hallii var. hallii TaxID=1504633 RepID=A0A2T7E6R7_9POAL|nr:hypothetical protein GQ55_3G074200 [Panicum hallii var. hallii]